MRSILLALGLLLSITTHAANKPDGFNKAAWDTLVAKIRDTGTTMNLEAGELRFLGVINPQDTSKNHHATYISVLGNYDKNQKYVIEDVSAVDEDWKTDGQGNWTIDQYTYHITRGGDLIAVEHTLLKEHEGQVLDEQEEDTGDVTSPENLGRWGQLLGAWTYITTAQAK